MQRKGNAIRRESQVKNQISIGIDMGGSLWATAVQDWEAGKMSYYLTLSLICVRAANAQMFSMKQAVMVTGRLVN